MTNSISKLLEQPFNKYYLGKIYKIYSERSNDIYIGSTCATLEKRFSTHLSHFKYKSNNLSVHKILEQGECIIELIEDYPCDSRKELERREGWYQLTMDCINKNIAGRTPKEYQTDNKEKLKPKPKPKIDKGKRIKCECGTYYYEINKEKHFKSTTHIKITSRIINANSKYYCECGYHGIYYNKINIHLNSGVHKYLTQKNI